MKAESTYILEILNILDKAKNDDYFPKIILSKVVKHLDLVQEPEMDLDKITTGVTKAKDSNYKKIEQIIDQLEREKPEITFDDISQKGTEQNISVDDIRKNIERLKQHGIIFEPRKNIYKKLV